MLQSSDQDKKKYNQISTSFLPGISGYFTKLVERIQKAREKDGVLFICFLHDATFLPGVRKDAPGKLGKLGKKIRNTTKQQNKTLETL